MTHARPAVGAATLLLLAPILVCFVGCEPAVKYGTVTGTVKLNGNPVEGVSVTFLSESGQAVAATTDASGSYKAEKVVVGKNMVGVVSPPDVSEAPGQSEKNRGSMDPNEAARQAAKEQAAKKKKASQIPDRYRDPASSQLTVNVTEGATTYDIPLSK